MDFEEYAAKISRKNDQDIYIIRPIGEGATSYVFLAQTLDNKKYAVKLYKDKEAYSNEVMILQTLTQSPHIVRLFSHGCSLIERGCSPYTPDIPRSFLNHISNFAVFEFLANFELGKYVASPLRGLKEDAARGVFLGVLRGVEKMHECGVSHGDIKMENVMLSKTFIPKLIDFGFSKLTKNGPVTIITGTKYYASPEAYMTAAKGYDGIKNDIFSLGVLLFVLVTGFFPFDRPFISDQRYKFIVKGEFGRFWEKTLGKEKGLEVSEEFKDLFCRMVCPNPKNRISAKEIKFHAWSVKNSSQKGFENNIKSNNKNIGCNINKIKLDISYKFHSFETSKNKVNNEGLSPLKKKNLSQTDQYVSDIGTYEDMAEEVLRIELKKRRDIIKQKLSYEYDVD